MVFYSQSKVVIVSRVGQRKECGEEKGEKEKEENLVLVSAFSGTGLPP